MAYHFAMTESRWSNVRLLCTSFCNATLNDSGFCPSPCVPECPATCHYLRIPSTINASSAPHSKGFFTLDPLFVATFACLAVGLLVACIYAVYLKHYSARARARQRSGQRQGVQIFDQLHCDSPSLGLNASAIRAIKVHTYMKADDPFRETQCAVCLSEFQDGEVLRILPKCNHAFHMPCVDVWLGSHISCPVCRACIVSHITVAPASDDQGSPAQSS